MSFITFLFYLKWINRISNNKSILCPQPSSLIKTKRNLVLSLMISIIGPFLFNTVFIFITLFPTRNLVPMFNLAFQFMIFLNIVGYFIEVS